MGAQRGPQVSALSSVLLAPVGTDVHVIFERQGRLREANRLTNTTELRSGRAGLPDEV